MSNKRWTLIKFFFAATWLAWIPIVLLNYDSQPVPTGIARIIDLSFLSDPILSKIIIAVSVVLLILYTAIDHWIVTTSMFVIGVLVYTFHDSQGAFQRNEIINLILLTQSIYCFREKSTTNKSLEYGMTRSAILATAAVFFVAGMSKVLNSGIYWVYESPNFSLQAYKSNMDNYYSWLSPYWKFMAENIPTILTEYPWLTRVGFASALLIELTVPIALFKPRLTRRVGLLLLSLLIGIWIMLGVIFPPYLIIVLLFFILARHSKKDIICKNSIN